MIASVASAILSPGFEPLAKIPLGLVLRRLEVAKLGLVSAAGGYAVLMAGAAVAFLVLRAFGAADTGTLLASPAAETLAHPSAADLLISLCGAFAGLVITSAFRNSVIAGALVAMRLIDAAAAFGVALVAGAPGLAAGPGTIRPRCSVDRPCRRACDRGQAALHASADAAALMRVVPPGTGSGCAPCRMRHECGLLPCSFLTCSAAVHLAHAHGADRHKVFRFMCQRRKDQLPTGLLAHLGRLRRSMRWNDEVPP